MKCNQPRPVFELASPGPFPATITMTPRVPLFSIHIVSIHVLHLYSTIDTITAWKKSHFILSDWSDFHMINSLSMVAYAFTRHILTSLSVDEMLLPRYMNLSTNFRGLPFRVEMTPSWLKLRFVCIHVEANASWSLLQATQQRFGLAKCICKKHYVIHIVCIC